MTDTGSLGALVRPEPDPLIHSPHPIPVTHMTNNQYGGAVPIPLVTVVSRGSSPVPQRSRDQIAISLEPFFLPTLPQVCSNLCLNFDLALHL